MNSVEEGAKEKEYIVENILNKRITKEGNLEYFIAWKNLPESENVWKPFIEILDYPDLIKSYENTLKHKNTDRKRKLSATEATSTESVQKKKAYVKDPNNEPFNINSFPEEILLKILQYLTQNELGQAAQVCRRWNNSTRNPALWQKVAVQFSRYNGCQNELTMKFMKNHLTFVTHLQLKFSRKYYWTGTLDFEGFCIKLKEKCPDLQTLVLHNAHFSLGFDSIVHLCSHYLPDLQVLVFRWTTFGDGFKTEEYVGLSQIEVLDASGCSSIERSSSLPFSKVMRFFPQLKKLYLACSVAKDSWFENDATFLHQLEVLNLAGSFISYRTFHMLPNHALNLTVLYLCYNPIIQDFYFQNSVFLQLRTICLRGCYKVTCEGIVYLIQSCHSLQDVNIDKELIESFSVHPFALANESLFEVVKNVPKCGHYERLNYLYD